MCGIAGIVSLDPSGISVQRIKRMTDTLVHRGPDGEGYWTDAGGRVTLGHRRLAVIDLTDAGRQPMHDLGNRYTITYNGEIYNYIELRETLLTKGYRFRSDSDTEVLLAMYDWQKEGCLGFLDGMFAFAIHDAVENKLFCARDRFGEKPFYYVHTPGKQFLFASEMKALWAGGIDKAVHMPMLYNYMAYGLVQNVNDKRETFYQSIFSLENSHYILLDTDSLGMTKKKYWDIDRSSPLKEQTERQAADTFRDLLVRSVGRRLRADVGVGSSLSGGLDSSLIVSIASDWLKERGQRPRTFSARFPGFSKDEGSFMQLVAAKVQAESYYVYPGGENLIGKINELYYYQEEPFGSASVLAQYAVMQSAREQGVTVLLDGQGADELLGGYRHYYPSYICELRKRSPRKALQAAGDYLKWEAQDHVNLGLIKGVGRIICSDFPSLSTRLKKGRAGVMQTLRPLFNKDFFAAYGNSCYLPGTPYNSRMEKLDGMLYYDTYNGSLSELLRYADRNSMAHATEVRLPFLDHELVQFLFRLPAEYKISGGWTKYILRKAFETKLPPEIAWRRDKVGFEVPQRQWMNNAEVRSATQGIRERLVEEKILHSHSLNVDKKASGDRTHTISAWSILMVGGLFS